MRIIKRVFGAVVVVGVLATVYLWGRFDENAERAMPFTGTAHAATSPPSVSPVGVVDPREVYYPGSEALAADEMRVVACGTGMPNQRTSGLSKRLRAFWSSLATATSSSSMLEAAQRRGSRR